MGKVTNGIFEGNLDTAQKMKFPADLVTFTKEILNGKKFTKEILNPLQFLYSETLYNKVCFLLKYKQKLTSFIEKEIKKITSVIAFMIFLIANTLCPQCPTITLAH